MDKINFQNGQQPAINDTNLNLLQTNVENEIYNLSNNVKLKQEWIGELVARNNETKTLNIDLSEYDIMVYRVRSDYAHYQYVIRIAEENDIPTQVALLSSLDYKSFGTVKYIRNTKTIELHCDMANGWDSIVLERIYGIKLNKS